MSRKGHDDTPIPLIGSQADLRLTLQAVRALDAFGHQLLASAKGGGRGCRAPRGASPSRADTPPSRRESRRRWRARWPAFRERPGTRTIACTFIAGAGVIVTVSGTIAAGGGHLKGDLAMVYGTFALTM